MEKKIPIFNLEITNDFEDDVEVDVVSLVDRPAIERAFLMFNDEFQDSYNDYPEAAVNNAKRALKWAEENGWGDCGEATGKLRANQIAKKENLTRETLARISGFKRHQQHKDVKYGEGCGGLMWDAWGGDAMVDWAERKLKQIDRQTFAIQDEEERIISGPLMLADTPIYRNDDNGEYYVVFTKETIKKIAQRFFKKGYQSNVNLMHEQGNLTEGMTMFESWIKDDKRGIKAMKGFEDVPDGSWFGSFKVDNDEVWQMVKEGKVRGFSVEGQFNYRKTGESKLDKLWASVLDVLAQIG